MTAPFLIRPKAAERPPLVAHVIHHLVIGGLENGLVNLINRIPPERYRHAIVCMTDFSDFSLRIQRDDVPIFAMHKKIGQDFGIYARLYRLFRRIRPDLVHSRNLTALDSLLPATLARVPCKIHGEHGRGVTDPDGKSLKNRLLRRLHRPMVDHYVALSKDLEQYLRAGVGVQQNRITQIYNGVDTELFHPARDGREPLPWSGCEGDELFVIGNVGRMQAVKDPLNLVRAFILLVQRWPYARKKLRLALVGDGPLRIEAEALLKQANMAELAWFTGACDDVPRVMRGFDLFVLPSLAEGISNTLLEAMASGLPAVATRVGGNPELMEEGRTGTLVPPADPHALAAAIREYVVDREMGKRHGSAARRVAAQRFSLDTMVKSYMDLYDRLLADNRHHERRQNVQNLN